MGSLLRQGLAGLAVLACAASAAAQEEPAQEEGETAEEEAAQAQQRAEPVQEKKVEGAEAKAATAEETAKQLTNPIADLVSIPFQFNWDQGVGPEDELRFTLNIQPVVPVSLTEKWSLIGRFIVPLVSQPPLVPGAETRFGMSDILFSLFFSPHSKGGLTWGVGPVFGLPTTTDPFLGSGKWQVGPTGVLVYLRGPWTLAFLANHVLSFTSTGDIDRSDVNRSFFQPVVAYTTENAFTFTLQSETIADWEADEEWTVPINFLASKLTKMGPFPLSVQLGGGVYVERPTGGPEWRMRLAFTIIWPRPPE